jgi:translation initiation factor IF-1
MGGRAQLNLAVGREREGVMRFTGERMFMGRVIEPVPGDRCRVQLDDGREILARVTNVTRGLYRLVPGERVAVSVCQGEEPVLTGFLTA